MSQIYQYLRHFNRSEFSNPDAMSTELLLKLDWAREKSETPFILTSTFRLNDQRTHGKGLAVDILCTNSKTRLIILKALLAVDFNRIGIYADHIHVDVAASLPPCLWHGIYPSNGETP